MHEPLSISVVVPVLHEQAIIAGLVRHLRALPGGESLEIIVVDGDPDGSTLAALDDDAVTAVRAPRGRGIQMNAGASHATGDVLLFLHADSRLPDSALDEIHALMADPRNTAGAFRLRFDNPRPVYRFMAWFVTLKTRLGRSPYGDQGIFMRRRTFEELGGFAPVRIMEDVELTRRIRRHGGRIATCPGAIVTSARRMEAEGVVRRVLRNTCMLTLFSLGVRASRLERHYPPRP